MITMAEVRTLIEYQKYVNTSDAEGRRRFAEVDAWFKSEIGRAHV